MPSKLSAPAALDRSFLETRCKILEIAANLDRIDSAEGADQARRDRRMAQVRAALAILLDDAPRRAERCQMAFSLPYDAAWHDGFKATRSATSG